MPRLTINTLLIPRDKPCDIWYSIGMTSPNASFASTLDTVSAPHLHQRVTQKLRQEATTMPSKGRAVYMIMARSQHRQKWHTILGQTSHQIFARRTLYQTARNNGYDRVVLCRALNLGSGRQTPWQTVECALINPQMVIPPRQRKAAPASRHTPLHKATADAANANPEPAPESPPQPSSKTAAVAPKPSTPSVQEALQRAEAALGKLQKNLSHKTPNRGGYTTTTDYAQEAATSMPKLSPAPLSWIMMVVGLALMMWRTYAPILSLPSGLEVLTPSRTAMPSITLFTISLCCFLCFAGTEIFMRMRFRHSPYRHTSNPLSTLRYALIARRSIIHLTCLSALWLPLCLSAFLSWLAPS